MKKLLLLLSLATAYTVHAQTVYQFNATVDNAWLNPLNWSINTLVPGTSAIAAFGTQPNGNGSNNGCNIDFSSVLTNNGVGAQVVGAIRVLSTRTKDMNIGNASPSVDGTLMLSGVTIGGTANVVVDNLMTGYDLHFNNGIVGNNRLMKLAFGANAVFNGGTNSRTEITTQVTSATNVTVNGGELVLARSGGSTFPSTTNFTVSSGTLHISTNQTINNLDLAAGTTLSVDDGVALTINGTVTDRGATVTAAGTGKVSYNPNAALNYTGTAAMTIGNEWPVTNNPTTVTVSNTGGLTVTSNRTVSGTVTVNSTLIMGTNQLATTALTVNSGATIKVGSTSTSGAIIGNFGTTNITLNSGSTVEFNGSGLQYTAGRTYSNLTVNNGSYGLSLLGAVTVSGALTLNSSTKLDLAGQALTLAGTLTGTGSLKGSSASTLNVAAAGTVGTLNFDQTTDGATNALSALAVSSGSVTLGSKLALYTGLNVSGGTLDLAAKNLVLKSNSTKTAYVADIKGTVTGASNVTVERYSPAWSTRRYRLMTCPVMGITINDAWQESAKWDGSSSVSSNGYGTLITGQQQGTASKANAKGFDYWSAVSNGSASLRYYLPGTSSTQASWQPVSSTLTPNAFDNHEAYLLFVRGDRTTYTGTTAGSATVRGTGTLKKGSYTISVPYNNGYTLIGNPYPSPVDFKAIYDANNTKIQSSFYVWKSSLGTGTGGYVLVRPVATGSSLYETIPGDGSQSTANRLIHSGEGFFVMPATGATSGNSITVQEAHKSITTPALSVFRQVITPPAKLYVNLFTGDSAKVLLDGALAQYNNNLGNDTLVTVGEENLQKAFNSSENLSLLQSGADWILRTAGTPQRGDTLRFRLWNTAVKNYQLEIRSLNFAPLGVTPLLVDHYLNTTKVINTNDATTVYPFAITTDAASKDPSRFFVVFKTTATLPLVISSLRVEEKSGSAKVKWSVSNEAGINAYQVEKSTDGTNFKTLAEVKARVGAGEQSYEQDDRQLTVTNYYRIKLMGATGEVKYSSVVKVQLGKTGEGVSLYPVPVSGNVINVQLTNKPQGIYTLTLFNSAGQAVLVKAIQHSGGSAIETINLGDGVSAGSYFAELKEPSENKLGFNLLIKK